MHMLKSIQPSQSILNFGFNPSNSIGKLDKLTILSKLGLDATNKELITVHAHATYDKDAALIDLHRIEAATIIGGNTRQAVNGISFDVEVHFNSSMLIINLLKRSNSKVITLGTFAESFRVRNEYFPITNADLMKKLNRCAGVGSGVVTIDTATQQIVKLKVLNGNTLPPHQCGIVLDDKDSLVTLTCTFANAGANICRLVA